MKTVRRKFCLSFTQVLLAYLLFRVRYERQLTSRIKPTYEQKLVVLSSSSKISRFFFFWKISRVIKIIRYTHICILARDADNTSVTCLYVLCFIIRKFEQKTCHDILNLQREKKYGDCSVVARGRSRNGKPGRKKTFASSFKKAARIFSESWPIKIFEEYTC